MVRSLDLTDVAPVARPEPTARSRRWVLLLVAGFVTVLLNPIVNLLQERLVPRRGMAVAIVTFWAVLVFIGLALAFGYPLVNGITHLADDLPTYVAKAEHGKGWVAWRHS